MRDDFFMNFMVSYVTNACYWNVHQIFFWFHQNEKPVMKKNWLCRRFRFHQRAISPSKWTQLYAWMAMAVIDMIRFHVYPIFRENINALESIIHFLYPNINKQPFGCSGIITKTIKHFVIFLSRSLSLSLTLCCSNLGECHAIWNSVSIDSPF